MANKEKKTELTPWQKEHAAFEQKKAAAAAKKAREEKRKKQPIQTESVIEKYDAPTKTPKTKKVRVPILKQFKNLFVTTEKKPVVENLTKMWPFLLLAIVGIVSSAYVISPLSKIGSFTPQGNQHESAKQIAAATNIKTGDHVWRIINSEKKIASNITNTFPRIKSVAITFKFPNHFFAKITEHRECLYLKTGNTYQIVLSNGEIVKDEQINAQNLKSMPVLDGFSAQETKSFAIAYETLKDKVKSQITTVTKTPTKVTKDFIAIEMKDGNEVRVPLSQMEDKLPYYTSVATQLTEPSVVDMEAGIYAKSKDAYQKDLDDANKKTIPSTSSPATPASATPTSGDSANNGATTTSSTTTSSTTASSTTANPTAAGQ